MMRMEISQAATLTYRIVLLGLAVLGPLPGEAAVRSSCDGNWVCVETEKSADGVKLYLVNKGTAPVAITVRTRTTNLESDAARTLLRTIPAGERQLAASYKPVRHNRVTRFRYWFDWAIGNHRAKHDKHYLYRLPYGSGKRFRVLQGFSSNFSHTGREAYAVDFDMPKGSAVHAARGGVVADTEESHDRGCWRKGCGKYANYIVVLHDDGTTGEYYHLMKNGAVVEPGERIQRGQLIGYSGNTGHTTMPHLHFAVYRPIEWGRTQSLRFKFGSADGVISQPRSGRRYRAD